MRRPGRGGRIEVATTSTTAEAAIRSLIERYFNALDRRDFAQLADCFTEDAQTTYLQGAWHCDGRAATVERLLVMRQFPASTHSVGNVVIRTAGDEVRGEVFATAHLLATNGLVHVRGLRYVDRYVRKGMQWRIASRDHSAIWQYDVPAAPALAADTLSALTDGPNPAGAISN